MVKKVFRSGLSISLTLLLSLALSTSLLGKASAAAATTPVTIAALCSDDGGAAQWRIGNANPWPVTVSWVDAGGSHSVSLPYGYTKVTTNTSGPTVTFEQSGQPDQTVAVSDQECAETVNGCVDGFDRSNLNFDWSPSGKVTVTTVNNAPLCEDVPIIFGAYTLPATYDGSGVFDDSSVPQQKFSSASAVLAAGTSGNVTLTTAVPNKCTDYQLDLYYAPEITTVSYSGQGAQLIYGKIYTHTADPASCTTGGMGGGQVLGASTTASAAPQVLADTGQSAVLPIVGASSLVLSAAAVNFSVGTRLKKLFTK